MDLTGLQIFKYMPAAKKLPQSNCKECGCQTCMAFSMKLAKHQVDIEKCPYAPQELKEIYAKNATPPQKTVEICGLKIGGENVLYRHEKTFVNPTKLAVIVDCEKPDYIEKIKHINNFGINIMSEKIGIDIIILKNPKNIENFGIPFIPYEEFCTRGLDIVEESDFESVKNYLIETRTKAVKNRDENCSKPVCVILKNGDTKSVCVRASFYLCKYANMLVFNEFDEEMFTSLILLRQNLYTDPQKTLQVESALYEFNQPEKNSIVFLTTNFALTFFAVANELENLNIPSYLIVVPAKGMSVLTAWSAQTINSEIVKKTLEELNVREKFDTRKIIIPGLLSDIVEELKNACPDFDFIVGTHEASAIGEFVEKLKTS